MGNAQIAEKRPAHRPSGYRKSFAEEARKLCENGATDWELAQHFKVYRSTISLWKAVHPEFMDAIKLGKGAADDRVERSLHEKAVGYSYESEKVHFDKDGNVHRAEIVEHVPPSDIAAMFFLKNRRPDEWRERIDINGLQAITLNIALGGQLSQAPTLAVGSAVVIENTPPVLPLPKREEPTSG